MRDHYSQIACFVLICLISGCGPSLAKVTGTVTLDGQPLDTGYITYAPAEGEGTPVTADISHGTYELQILPGKKFVQISAPKVVGMLKESESPSAVEVPITEERLHERYWSGIELEFEVQPGDNVKDWTVEAKTRK